MKDYDNLTEISVEHNDETIVEYWSNSIPRIGEDIAFNDDKFKVVGVIHHITKSKDSYVKIEVLVPYGYKK